MKYNFDCKDFNGYKPCRPGWVCETCREAKPQGFRILIINLDALGDVLMTTALLPTLKTIYPCSTIRWLTSPGAVSILQNNPYIDEIIPYNLDSVSYLKHMTFDLILSCDRDRKSTAMAMSIPSSEKRGFGLGPQGVIVPLNPEFEYAYRLGLDDDLKFKRNTQTGQQILAEGMGFHYIRHEYILRLTDHETAFIQDFRQKLNLDKDQISLGVNTGCSEKFRYKKLPFDSMVAVLKKILNHPNAHRLHILLLGGNSETEYNAKLKQKLNDSRVIETPTTEGIRKGLLYIAASDVCLTGDTFGLHAAIGLKIPSVALFTISCDQEIDLYDRGSIICADVPCRPCWKPVCPDPICMNRFNLDQIAEEVWQLLQQFVKK